MTSAAPHETTIKGRTYAIEAQHTGPLVSAHLLRQEWDGTMYILTGKRGGMFLAYRSAQDGHFERAC